MGRRSRQPYRGADRRTRQAKAAGYPARSVFKLAEIDQRVGLLRPGQRVLDLGAAPGSWSAYAAERIGPTGRIVAVDRQPLGPRRPAVLRFVQGDVLQMEAAELDELAPYHVVLSDMAPQTTGDRSTDQWRSFELFQHAVELGSGLLGAGGSFVGKLFMSGSFDEARDQLRAEFDEVRVIRPQGTRKSSFEIFLVGLGRRREGAAAPPGGGSER